MKLLLLSETLFGLNEKRFLSSSSSSSSSSFHRKSEEALKTWYARISKDFETSPRKYIFFLIAKAFLNGSFLAQVQACI